MLLKILTLLKIVLLKKRSRGNIQLEKNSKISNISIKGYLKKSGIKINRSSLSESITGYSIRTEKKGNGK